MDDKWIEESNRTRLNNPFLPPEAGDELIDATTADALRETVSIQLIRIRNRAILLAINLGLWIGVLIVLSLITSRFSSASVHDDWVFLSVAILAVLAAEVFLIRLIVAHSRAVASPELIALTMACEAQANCVKAGALIIFSILGAFITLAFIT